MLGFNVEGGMKNFCFSINDFYLFLYEYFWILKSFNILNDGFFFCVELFYNVVFYIDEIDVDREVCGNLVINFYGGILLYK